MSEKKLRSLGSEDNTVEWSDQIIRLDLTAHTDVGDRSLRVTPLARATGSVGTVTKVGLSIDTRVQRFLFPKRKNIKYALNLSFFAS